MNQDLIDTSKPVFVEVLLPLALPQTYTYAVPIDLLDEVRYGVRAEVPLRNKLYSGIIMSIHQDKPIGRTKNVVSILDRSPIIHEQQTKFWTWMAQYYHANLGEVMNVALPAGLKLASETKFVINSGINLDDLDLSDDEYLITEAMSIQQELTTAVIQDILDKKTVYPIIKSLMHKRVLYIKEELKHRYKVRTEDFISLLPPYDVDMEAALDAAGKSEHQKRALLSLMSLSQRQPQVLKKSVYEMSGANSSVIKGLEKKGIIKVESREVSRIALSNQEDDFNLAPLSDDQAQALGEIKTHFEEDKVTLLHGITGSGKTRIYVELILEVLAAGGQVLLLLPEIALTTQIVDRLMAQIGSELLVYHSKINDHERVEIWNAAMYANKLFVGARSSLFLPFSDLRLVIIDEEHDSSFKQDSPNPKYQGRDSAIMLAKIYGAKVLLGTATPSLESMYNAAHGKYGYVTMTKRYGNSKLPSIEVINLQDAYKKGLMKEHFSAALLDEIKDTVARGEQVILFQNRRGYAPIQRCNFCAWTAECPNCDVTLTYHQAIGDIKCHYCGYRQRKFEDCPACGNHDMHMLGAGTERIEETLSTLLPEVRVARFDYDTTRTKGKQEQMLADFRLRQIDILVGTQMITKGFDFDNISLVGIISADGLFSFPDFRAAERSYQLLTQVSGRAGRRETPGKVLIQAFKIDHPVLRDVIENNYDRFFQRESLERKEFLFPPHFNLIAIWTRHQELQKTKKAAQKMSAMLSSKLGKRVQGPVDPPLLRVRNKYQQVIYIRIEKDHKVVNKVKQLITGVVNVIKTDKEVRQVSISVDVDPY